ncbi:ubiquitin-protein ligase-like protein [Tricladium varicosporioides]|nr:ubiquitin-protein ligase-like protein [Hymenoscyphus varicosporioides]
MATAAFENTARFDLGSWAANWTAFNATQYVPSAKDLALAGPRMFMKLGSFLAVPEAVDNIFGVRMGQRFVPEATGAGIVEAVTTAAASAREVAQSATEILVDVDEQTIGLASRFSMEGARSLSNVFGYATSKWAILCFGMALILNRTQIYASTRRNLTLPWKVRLLLRITPIILLTIQCRSLLQSIQCQTSPDFALLRWGNASKHSDLMFTQDGGYLHAISSTILLKATDEQSCLAVGMIPPVEDETESPGPNIITTSGSLSRLWPLFETFCFSHVTETLSCAVQGRTPAAETGMTIFEHSLAFAEAEAAISNQLGMSSFGSSKNVKAWKNTSSDEATEIAITRNMIMGKVNTAAEVLLVGFLSGMNHLTSHILAIFNLQGRMRLINTGFWGLAFMSVIIRGILTFDMDNLSTQSLLRFPTVCIVGFIPHVLVLLGIICCFSIYAAALALSALAPPDLGDENRSEHLEPDEMPRSRSGFFRRILQAHQNMQANVPLSSIRITMHMDFYTALLRTGFSVMTMASEAVYLNESRGVNIKQRTWLEEDRLREIEAVGAQWLGPNFRLRDPDSQFGDGLHDSVGLVAAKDQPMDLLRESSSGYAREMTAQKKATIKGQEQRAIRDGVGATERSGRWIMALEFFLAINRLLIGWWAALALKALAKVGVETRPRFLIWLSSHPKAGSSKEKKKDKNDPDSLNFWLLSIDGELTLPKDEHVDVEAEMRNRLRNSQGFWDYEEEEKLETNLYRWWLSGGWWGGDDNSGEFIPDEKEIDDDTTSVISFATTDDNEWESEDDGQRTPTRTDPQGERESTPITDTPLNSEDLAQLLHPKTPEQRAESHALAAHLSSNTIMTRSRYKALAQRERARVLTSTLHRPPNFARSSHHLSTKLTPEEETQILEHLIISRRQFHASTSKSATGHATSWSRGASGMGESGPQCVVCQSNPRSIIVWPCRCLSLCDDCRVTLAMNNFDKCVCCRRDVASFSRIFVP